MWRSIPNAQEAELFEPRRTWPNNHDTGRLETILMVVTKKVLGHEDRHHGLREQLVLDGYHYSRSHTIIPDPIPVLPSRTNFHAWFSEKRCNFDNVQIHGEWRHGRMETWQNGDMTEWRHDRMETWQNGDMTEWRHGRMEIWHLLYNFWCFITHNNILAPKERNEHCVLISGACSVIMCVTKNH